MAMAAQALLAIRIKENITSTTRVVIMATTAIFLHTTRVQLAVVHLGEEPGEPWRTRAPTLSRLSYATLAPFFGN